MSAAMGDKLVKVGETDAYVLATESRMGRRQGRHVSCTVLELSAVPDFTRLRTALEETMRRHPILGSAVSRPLPSLHAWYVRSKHAADTIPLHLHEGGSAAALLDHLLNDAGPELEKPRRCHVRMDAVIHAGGTCDLILTWRHIVLDGVGAEWLVREIAALWKDPSAESVAPGFSHPTGSKRDSLHERWQATKPMLDHLMGLLKTGIRSLTPPGSKVGRLRFSRHVLTEEESAGVKQRAATIGGPLVQTHFYLAAAILAHHAVWRGFRGGLPEQDVVALPLQDRPRGKPGPIFRNNVSVMFLHTRQDEAGDIATLTTALIRRQQEAMRAKLADSFAEMQRWMMILPSPVYAKFLDMQMKGQTTSFHHSHTGLFAGGLESFCGAAITNAWHAPGFYGPPGTGVFVGEHRGRMAITTSWRDGVLTTEEASALQAAFISSLTGRP
ncbi:hypothetical protein OVA24_01060 [Luteolibacter sp. SL250]|uniref:hypothetical protein n=1 Tax=Luteolibacter sp. SL250 TaxID=2995170 RepID=UPI00226DD0CC|nr:hypothetical protein [Luteolibacter sp. SL250]WAC19966.1 hypothetical protein OVA24_01060 [Luteolibacter sp. SL250]